MANLDTDFKGELAFQTVIRDAETGFADDQIFITFQDQTETIEGDFVVINCLGGLEDGQGSGNERLTFRVSVYTRADRNEEADEAEGSRQLAHRENCGEVFDALNDTNLAAQLTAAVEDFTVFDSIVRSRGPNGIDNRNFVSSRNYELSCAPSDIS